MSTHNIRFGEEIRKISMLFVVTALACRSGRDHFLAALASLSSSKMLTLLMLNKLRCHARLLDPSF